MKSFCCFCYDHYGNLPGLPFLLQKLSVDLLFLEEKALCMDLQGARSLRVLCACWTPMWSTLEDAGLAQNMLAADAQGLTPQHPSVHPWCWKWVEDLQAELSLSYMRVQGFEPTPSGGLQDSPGRAELQKEPRREKTAGGILVLGAPGL